MFNKLVASSKTHRAWNPGTVFLSVAAHVVIGAAVVIATAEKEDVAPPPPKPE